LRSEYERRAALVEIDALVAVWLGIKAEELSAIFSSRYAVLASYEAEMWFDAKGRRIAREFHAQGVRQSQDSFRELMAYFDDPERNPVPEGYTAPFYRADREEEYRQAHAEFSRRLVEGAGTDPCVARAQRPSNED
jgi:hypothetical protein